MVKHWQNWYGLTRNHNFTGVAKRERNYAKRKDNIGRKNYNATDFQGWGALSDAGHGKQKICSQIVKLIEGELLIFMKGLLYGMYSHL